MQERRGVGRVRECIVEVGRAEAVVGEELAEAEAASANLQIAGELKRVEHSEIGERAACPLVLE